MRTGLRGVGAEFVGAAGVPGLRERSAAEAALDVRGAGRADARVEFELIRLLKRQLLDVQEVTCVSRPET